MKFSHERLNKVIILNDKLHRKQWDLTKRVEGLLSTH